MTSRELVYATLEFRNYTHKAPKQLWLLPWAQKLYPNSVHKINNSFKDDIVIAPYSLNNPSIAVGDPYKCGEYIDEWGCHFKNIQEGVIGEVKEPLVKTDDWSDANNVHIPWELLDFDIQKVNEFCHNTDQFVLSGCCPRPFEQLQFIRTTEELYMDLVYPSQNMLTFMNKMHDFYCCLIEKWAQTDIDAINFMDDWGSQNSLLINPATWENLFKPMYRDYISIAKKYDKKTFMHSDGNILSIYPHLIELGLDAINSQIFCMGLDKLSAFRGKITFWGEIDRQHILVKGTVQDVANAVESVYENLWSNGGCIAQCEFGPGALPENVHTVFQTWANLKK